MQRSLADTMDREASEANHSCVLETIVKRSVVKSYINLVKQKNTPIAVVCFGLNLSSQAEEKLEKIIILLEQINNFSPVYQCESGLYFTFFRNMQLHHSVQVLKTFNENIEKLHEISISYGALTIIDENDTYENLMFRISKYIDHACIIGGGKIRYGTSQYDFSTKKDEEDILKNFFISSSRAKLYNFYNGIPLSEEVEILSYSNGMLRIKVSFGKATFLKNETFTFLRHELLPDTLKADIINTFPKQGEVVLSNLRFIEESPVDRTNIRAKPDNPIPILIKHNNDTVINGTIQSISVNTVAVKIENQKIPNSYFESANTHFMLIFKLQNSKGNDINIRIVGIYLARNDDQVIFTTHMSRFLRQKIENYIKLQQTKLMTIVQKMVLDFYQK